MSALAEQEWLAELQGADVRGFLAELDVDVPGWARDEATVRCFARPESHNREDRNASCSVSLRTGLWLCHACGEKGNACQAAVACGHSARSAAMLARRFGLMPQDRKKEAPLPGVRQHRKWQMALAHSPKIVARLFELKGWTLGAMAGLGVGWDGERLTFPVRNEKGKMVNCVRYLPGGKPKMLSIAGRPRDLFPPPEVLHPFWPVFVVEGEPAAVSMWSAGLQAVGVPGAGRWSVAWARRLNRRGRDVFVLPDCDEAGRRLALEVRGTIPGAKVFDLNPDSEDQRDIGDEVADASKQGGVWQVRRWLCNARHAA